MEMEDFLRDYDADYRQFRQKILRLVIRQPKMLEPTIRLMTKGRNYIRRIFAPFNI